MGVYRAIPYFRSSDYPLPSNTGMYRAIPYFRLSDYPLPSYTGMYRAIPYFRPSDYPLPSYTGMYRAIPYFRSSDYCLPHPSTPRNDTAFRMHRYLATSCTQCMHRDTQRLTPTEVQNCNLQGKGFCDNQESARR